MAHLINKLKKLFPAKPTVAVLPLQGVINANGGRDAIYLDLIDQQLLTLKKVRGLKALVLNINCPGGAPAQAALIGQSIKAAAAQHKVPVVAFVQDVAASGGYWLACVADQIFVDHNSIVGSIGVISAGFGWPDFIKRHGIERRVHTSGTNKNWLDPFKPEKAEDVERLLELQSVIHENFKNHVRAHRGTKLTAPADVIFNGEFWDGAQALEFGLVDGYGHLRNWAVAQFGKDVKLQSLAKPKKFWQNLFKLELRADSLLSSLETTSQWQRFGL